MINGQARSKPFQVGLDVTYKNRHRYEHIHKALQWRLNEGRGVSNHRHLSHLFRRTPGKTSKLCVTGLCEGNPPVTGGFSSQRASDGKNVSIWWRHHGEGCRYSRRYRCTSHMIMEWKSFLHHMPFVLQWRYNERNGVLNHQHHECLLNRVFRRRSKKTSKLRVTGVWEGNSPGTGEFPAQRASNAENVFVWWRHHGEGNPPTGNR